MQKKYILKLKAGFFKTNECFLIVTKDNMTLEYCENETEMKIIIPKNELTALQLTRRNEKKAELEITTLKHSYLGSLEEQAKIEELLLTLTREYDKKFMLV